MVRLAGLEPATSWFVASRKETTGGSVEPLPLISLTFRHTPNHPRPPRAATDCQSFVSQLSAGIEHPTHDLHFSAPRLRRSHSRLPVPRPLVPVRHDQDAVR